MKRDDPILVRAPRPNEGVIVTGWGLAEALRLSLDGNEDLDTPGFHAALERLEVRSDPIATQVAPHLHLFGPLGPLDDKTEMCWPSTRVAVKVPNLEGVLPFLNNAGMTNVCAIVDRIHLGLLEDPWAYWPDAQDASKAADSNHLFALLHK